MVVEKEKLEEEATLLEDCYSVKTKKADRRIRRMLILMLVKEN